MAVDAGTAVLSGLVGAGASIVTTVVSDWLRNRRTDRLLQIRKERLMQLLSGSRYTWRSIDTLADAIGCDHETTAGLLLELGCRRSMAKGRSSWALVSRAPFPDDVP